MARYTCSPNLPANFPHRATILNALGVVEHSRLWQAYLCEALGDEVAESLLLAQGFQLVAGQDDSISAEKRISLLLNFELAVLDHCDTRKK